MDASICHGPAGAACTESLLRPSAAVEVRGIQAVLRFEDIA